jgi:transglutaminase-like putative cysteine protease
MTMPIPRYPDRPDDYLKATEIIDWQHPSVLDQARKLANGTALETARRCFEFVRDEVRHSHDFRMNPVTCRASDVLQNRTGYCYAKSHLLAALLRANGIPAGMCYQRLRFDAGASDHPKFCLHGLNALLLPDVGWYRVDARGNKPNVNAQFAPPIEHLAFGVVEPGEADLPWIWADPMPEVVASLQSYATYDQLAEHLPDVETQSLT